MSGRISGYIIGPAFSEGGCYHQRREVLQRAFDRTGAPVASTVDQLHDLLHDSHFEGSSLVRWGQHSLGLIPLWDW